MAYDAIPYAAQRWAQPVRRFVAFGRLAAESLTAHWVYLSLLPPYVVGCVLAGQLADASDVVQLEAYSRVFPLVLVLSAVIGFVGLTAWVMVRPPKGSLLVALWRAYRAHIFDGRRLVYFFTAILPIPLFFSTFTSFKRMIPSLNPFSWDETLMQWDLALHGSHPWELLQPVLGYPLVSSGINFVYHLWLFVMLITLIWQCWSRRDDLLRMQYLVSFVLCWMVLGTLVAALLSSGGPVYYGRLTGLEDPFAPLMQYLREADKQHTLWVLHVQEILWEAYVDPDSAIGRGISAMPSMHVSSSVLMALLGWRIHRWVGAAYTIFAALIMIGSVHLAWHYAIDGYVAAAGTVVIWWMVGKLLRKLSAARRQGLAAPATT